MKSFAVEKHPNKKIAWLRLYAISDLEQSEQLEKMLRIAEIFEVNSFYAICQVLKNNKVFEDIAKTCQTVAVYTRKKYDTFALNAEGNRLADLIRFAAINDECTEIVVLPDVSWEQFVSQKGYVKKTYDLLFLIKDNCETYLAFNKERYDFEQMKLKISQIL
jgi:hypothetical protein